MKKVVLSIAIVIATSLTSCKNETKQENKITTDVSKEMAMSDISFGVRGNCGMCKNTIEKAVNNIAGVSKANWDVEKKKIDVIFDDSKTNELAIHKAIATSGYDTDKVLGSDEVLSKFARMLSIRS
ncbi:heavy-metal-associated domain-containing protein [Thalassobellus suaedae]|uniref:Cation transporter n=1 Tax=Thalassobellus suaedae TaxID=3074124 RepID=A0ABY9XWX8_9FLAO|nr:cation transporter [Flavobacteriaceae bacterium HL-DH14]